MCVHIYVCACIIYVCKAENRAYLAHGKCSVSTASNCINIIILKLLAFCLSDSTWPLIRILVRPLPRLSELSLTLPR